MKEYPWLEIAKQELGVKEISGSGDNSRIVEYLQSTTLGSPENENDETPWCSAFVNWCVVQSGFEGTNSAWARGWLAWGIEADWNNLQGGEIVVLSRGVSSGHVGFYIDSNESTVTLLGGNQNDQVCEAQFAQDRILGIRIPA